MIKYQNYKHYKLPITINPIDYGKLITKIDSLNLFILQITKTNIVLLTEYDKFNHIKVYKEGEFRFEYKDFKIDDNTFIRSLDNRKFTFKNNILVNTTIRILTVLILTFVIFYLSKNNSITLSTLFPLIFKRQFSENSKNYNYNN